MSIDASATQTYLCTLALVHAIVIFVVTCIAFNLHLVSNQMQTRFREQSIEYQAVLNQLWDHETRYANLLRIAIKNQEAIEQLERIDRYRAEHLSNNEIADELCCGSNAST